MNAELNFVNQILQTICLRAKRLRYMHALTFGFLIFCFDAHGQTEHHTIYGAQMIDAITCRQVDTLYVSSPENAAAVIHIVELADFGGVCGGACLCFDQLVEFKDAQWNMLAVDSSPSSGNRNNRHRTILGPESLPDSGTYAIIIRDKENNGRGQYSAYIQNINSPSRASMLQAGDSLIVSLNRGEVDSYTFESWPLDITQIRMRPLPGSAILPQLALYNQKGQTLALSDSGAIDYVFSDGGFYTLLAHSAVDEEGDYSLVMTLEMPHANQPPLAIDDAVETSKNTKLAIDVLANDSDPDGHELLIAATKHGQNGTVTNNGTYVVYRPNEDFTGADEFIYTVTDRSDSTSAKVTVQVHSVTTSINENTTVPMRSRLIRNYPNPFNPSTLIEFEIATAQQVSLRVFNLLGQHVATLINRKVASGRHKLKFVGANLQAGVYKYVLKGENFVDSGQMTLVK